MSRVPASDALMLGMVGAGTAVAVGVTAPGSPVTACAVALAPLTLLAAVTSLATVRATPPTVRLTLGVVGLLALSAFVWRVRGTAELQDNPLDGAAALRVGLVMVAALVVTAAWALNAPSPRNWPASRKWLAGYAAAAAAAALVSPNPPQAFYRAFELAVGLAAIGLTIGVARKYGPEILFRALVIGIGVILSVIWVEAFLFPAQAWTPSPGIGYSLSGYLPGFSSNTVGTLGAILAILGTGWPSIARNTHRARVVQLGLVIVGLLTLAASQYRTGVLGITVVALLMLTLRRDVPTAMLGVVIGSSVVLIVGANGVISAATGIFSKGQAETTLSTLNSRTVYWEAAIPSIRERPILGWGLNVGTRETLQALGNDDASTLHGTWLEAALGTGLVGMSLLAAALGALIREAWSVRRISAIGLASLGVVLFLLVRSFTGTTFELFGVTFVILIVLIGGIGGLRMNTQ